MTPFPASREVRPQQGGGLIDPACSRNSDETGAGGDEYGVESWDRPESRSGYYVFYPDGSEPSPLVVPIVLFLPVALIFWSALIWVGWSVLT
ncbi:MAG: hypothetical protein EP321_11315 [Sphingomonadales bacterium]|nr:MAG: hypothetical protein EP345_01680 [Sphingomonadales bacterium]TNF03162.1 MAG: hypothetical protein EP321_11315 [Sphingomonadales bacterium]